MHLEPAINDNHTMKEKEYAVGKKFESVQATLTVGEYENCTFGNCDFSNVSLSDCNFTDCEFDGCNLGMAKLFRTTFNGVRFRKCKLLGLAFKDCSGSLFSAEFEDCSLDLASFHGMKLKKIRFVHSSMHEVDFTGCDLSGSTFENCDLGRAIFENTILEKADFRSSFNYTIDPERNRVRKARFSLAGVAGLLAKYDVDLE